MELVTLFGIFYKIYKIIGKTKPLTYLIFAIERWQEKKVQGFLSKIAHFTDDIKMSKKIERGKGLRQLQYNLLVFLFELQLFMFNTEHAVMYEF